MMAMFEEPAAVLRAMVLVSHDGPKPDVFHLVAFRQLAGRADEVGPGARWAEFRAWALSPRPSLGLVLLLRSGWLPLFPELDALVACPQEAAYHPEGPVWAHIRHVCDAAARIAVRDALMDDDRVILVLAALCHDIGKPCTTIFEGGRIRSPGHAEAGVPIAAGFLRSIGCPDRIIDRVKPMVAEHMVPFWDRLSGRTVARLQRRLAPATLSELVRLIEADHSGRPPLPAGLPVGAEQLFQFKTNPPPPITPILRGRDLIARGWEPGPAMGAALKAALEAQVDGEFEDVDGGIRWLESQEGAAP